MMYEKEPLKRDWIEEQMLEKLDYCKYDIRVKCYDPETRDCEYCDRNPENRLTIKV